MEYYGSDSHAKDDAGSERGIYTKTKLKPRWDVHLSGEDDQLGCAGESLSSVLGE